MESSQVAPLRVIDLRVMNVLADSPNIFHVFALEVNRVFQLIVEDIESDWAVLIHSSHRLIWRGFVLSGLVPVFCNASEIDRDYVFVQLPPLDSGSWLVDPHQFLCYRSSSIYRAMVRRILIRHGCLSAPDQLIDVVFVKRLFSRILLDSASMKPIEALLDKACRDLGLSFRVASFEDMAPLEQVALMRQTRLLVGVHGAGLTNLVFLQDSATVFEVDFRKYWSCDPVCKDHFSGRISFREKCSDAKPYHKADFHNLAGLFGKNYDSLSIDGVMGRTDVNPISVAHVLLNGDLLINKCFQLLELG
ncbi:glycosyltransferase family 61 protein [Synechococcus sp. PROS-U-1]|uniref:glycosyltransferase family 61 protein n=1 Tax=Synechococcus sp. PROS-U-1 TaxID=1400866 RepID=UPI0016494B57|nr:glycosyltransferase family 61 protein [Synechococcus sp. PROS-U-1]